MADLSLELDKDLKGGMSATDLRKKYSARLAARSILMALGSDNELTATTNIKDLTDRAEGRASEKARIPNPLEKLTDEQLEALLRTEISDLQSTKEKVSDGPRPLH